MSQKKKSMRTKTATMFFSVATAILSSLTVNSITVKADPSLPSPAQIKNKQISNTNYANSKLISKEQPNSQKQLQPKTAESTAPSAANFKWGNLDVSYSNHVITVPSGSVGQPDSLAHINGINSDDVQEVKFTGQLKIGSASEMFKDLTNLTKITGLENLDTSATSDMRYMFANCQNLTSIDGIDNLQTSKVTNMSFMFAGCSKLASLNLSSFNTANTSYVESMFQDCENLQNIKFSPDFTIAKVDNINRMFNGCSSLTALDLSKFNTSQVKKMIWTFKDCSSLTKLDLSSFDTSNVIDMNGMFNNCSSLKELDLRSFVIDPNIDKGYMLDGLAKLNTLKLGKSTYINDTHLNTPGTWVNIGNGNEDAPQANNKYLSEDLIAHAHDILGDTYIRPGSPITVSYLDTSKRPLTPDISLKGKIGADYKVTAKTIPGYIVKEVPDNATGVFTDQPQNVEFIYSSDPESNSIITPIKAADVTVYYQDENGNQIAPETVLQGNVGDGYTTGIVEIPDYTLKVRPENATGFFSTEPQSVTYIYARNNAIPEENDQNSPTNSSSNNPSQKGTSQTNESQNKHKFRTNGVTENYTIFKSSDSDSDSTNPVLITNNGQEEELPQTGTNERSQIIVLLLGFLSVICSLLASCFSKKKKG
ncbi:BspA family leucine-rich repeat surface protein [Lactobacillus kullabergensis]|uniref:MucBP domain-containing protein n=1 Tax=Lactobacillus kullabergensis TaxID=1218493 RepID=UPI002246A0D5|nr:MucBP domain-containing protein [Lactobacillus kullabergensis]MCX0291711.1 BspA family leucine-rich repeat surface protein [Lactobacillus kullabergensis]